MANRWHIPTVADYDRVIALLREIGGFQPMIRQCKRERKSLLAREKVKRQLQDPEFRRKLREGRAAAYKIPEKEAARVEKFRQSFGKLSRALPPMTPEQYHQYRRITRNGAKRHDALRVILSPAPTQRTAGRPADPLGRPAPIDRVAARVDRRVGSGA